MAPLNESLATTIHVIETKPLVSPKLKPALQENCFNLSQGILRAKHSSPILFDVPQNLTFTPFASHSISTDAPLPTLLRVQANAHKGGFLGFTQESLSDLLTNSLGRFEDREFLSVFRFKMWWSTAWVGKSGSDLQAETQWVMLKVPEIDSYVAIIPIIEGSFRAALNPGENGNVLISVESGSTKVKESSFNAIAYVHICDSPYDLMREAFSALRVHMNTFKLLEEKKLPTIVDKFGWCTWDACYLTVDPATIWTGVKEFEDGGVCPKFVIIDDGWQSISFDGDEAGKDAENLVLGGEQMTARLHSFEECKKFRNYKGGSFLASDASHFDPHKPKMIIYKATERIQAIIEKQKLIREFGEHDLPELDEKIKKFSEELNAMFDGEQVSLGSKDVSGSGMKAFTKDLRTRFKNLDGIYVWHALCGAWNGVRPESLTHLESKVVPFDISPGLDASMTDLAVDRIVEAGIGLVHPSKAHEFYDSMHSYLASVGVTGAKIDVFQTLESVAEEHGGRVELAKSYYDGLTKSMVKNFNGTEIIASMQQCNEFFFLATKQISIGRVGDDFWWQDPHGDPQGVYWLQGLHMIHCSYNSLWMGQMIQPDWDMFQSDHVCAEYHAASRAISGGPIYLSDHLGQASHNFELIKKLAFFDGTVPRCLHYALPTRDSLFKNPLFDKESILKIFNFNKFGGVIGAFNCQGAGWSPKEHRFKGYKECYMSVSGTIHVSDIEWDQNPEAVASQVIYTGDYLVYKNQSEEILFMNLKSDAMEITLEPSSFDLFSFVPVTELGSSGVRFAPLGLVNMFNCVGTVQEMEITGDNSITVEVKGEGSFMAYSSSAPEMCYVGDKKAEFKWEEETGKLSFCVPWVEDSGGISRLSISKGLTFLSSSYLAASRASDILSDYARIRRGRDIKEQVFGVKSKTLVCCVGMDQIVSGEEEEELGVDIEEGVGFNDITTNQEDVVLDQVWNGRLSYEHRSENTTDDDEDGGLINPLIQDGKRRERSSQSLDLSDRKFDSVKVKKTRKPSSKPPRPPKGPLLTANDQKLMREIAELAMRKRARIERMRRMKAAKSSSPCSSILAMIVTVIFFAFLIFQGFFTSNASLSSDNSPAPDNNRMVSVQFYNEFAPRERIDPSPTTTFRYKRVSGADNEENTREVNR